MRQRSIVQWHIPGFEFHYQHLCLCLHGVRLSIMDSCLQHVPQTEGRQVGHSAAARCLQACLEQHF